MSELDFRAGGGFGVLANHKDTPAEPEVTLVDVVDQPSTETVSEPDNGDCDACQKK